MNYGKITICHVQAIIDHPCIGINNLIRLTGLSEATIIRIRKQLGIKRNGRKHPSRKATPEQLAARNDWKVYPTALALERYGYTDYTTGRIMRELGCDI